MIRSAASAPALAVRRSASARRWATNWRTSTTSIPEIIAKAGEGDPAAVREYDEHRLAEVSKSGGGEHRPSMGQDMVKGRRTEIEFLNGLIVRKGEEIGIPDPGQRGADRHRQAGGEGRTEARSEAPDRSAAELNR